MHTIYGHYISLDATVSLSVAFVGFRLSKRALPEGAPLKDRRWLANANYVTDFRHLSRDREQFHVVFVLFLTVAVTSRFYVCNPRDWKRRISGALTTGSLRAPGTNRFSAKLSSQQCHGCHMLQKVIKNIFTHHGSHSSCYQTKFQTVINNVIIY